MVLPEVLRQSFYADLITNMRSSHSAGEIGRRETNVSPVPCDKVRERHKAPVLRRIVARHLRRLEVRRMSNSRRVDAR